MTVDELQSSLLVHEQKFTKRVRDDQVLKAEQDASNGRGRGRGRGYTYRGRGRGRGRSQFDFDKSTIECFKCHQLGHFAYECGREEKPVNYAEFEEGEDLLLMMHAEPKQSPKESMWFLDSGC